MSLTEEQKAAYLDHPSICPYCGCEDIEAIGSVDIDGTVGTNAIKCLGCHKMWTDVYKLVNVYEEVE